MLRMLVSCGMKGNDGGGSHGYSSQEFMSGSFFLQLPERLEIKKKMVQ